MDNAAPRTSRRTLPYRLWLAGIALGTLGAVLIAPTTGWIARQQLGVPMGMHDGTVDDLLVDLGLRGHGRNRGDSRPESSGAAGRAAILEAHPNDFALSLAAALRNGQERRRLRAAAGETPAQPISLGTDVRALDDRFAGQPGLYAAAIRMDTMGAVRILRPEKAAISGEKLNPHQADRQSDPRVLAAFDRDCETGERLEPDNGFFPAMRAVGYFAANLDHEALDSLVRASHKTSWDEHIAEEVTGRWALAEAETGRVGAITRTAIAAGILFPHYSQLRSATQLATFKAMQMELAGNPAEGAKVRLALMRIGDLMRVHCTSLIGNLVGIACTNIAVSRPAGAPVIKVRTDVGEGVSARERDESTRKRFGALARYWQQNGLKAHVPEAEQYIEAGVRVRRQLAEMIPVSPFNEHVLGPLVLLWCAGALALANAWWLLVCGAIGAIILSRRQHGGRERMPRSGPFVLVVVAVLFAWLCVHVGQQQTQYVETQINMLSVFQGLNGESGSRAVSILNVYLFAAIPILLSIVSIIASVVRRIPLRVGLAVGFSRVGIPVACLLALGFSGLCVVTARYEERVNSGLEQVLAHEGRYLSRLTGQPWPGSAE